MKIVGGLVALLLLSWLGGTSFVALQLKAAGDERQAQNAQIVAMGEKAAAELRAIEGPPLTEACAGKLPTATPDGFVTYSLKLPALERPTMSGSMKRVDGIVTRMNDRHEYLEHTGFDPPPADDGLPFQYSMSPDDWTRLLRDAEQTRQQTAAVKVVLLDAFSELRGPTLTLMRDTFSAGGGTYRARVVAFPSGQVLCEGTGAVHMKVTKVTGHGGSAGDAQADSERELSDDWVRAAISSPLDDVCKAGGDALCSATRLEVSPPDW